MMVDGPMLLVVVGGGGGFCAFEYFAELFTIFSSGRASRPYPIALTALSFI